MIWFRCLLWSGEQNLSPELRPLPKTLSLAPPHSHKTALFTGFSVVAYIGNSTRQYTIILEFAVELPEQDLHCAARTEGWAPMSCPVVAERHFFHWPGPDL